MAHRFKEYQPFKGDIERRTNGSIIAMESGTAFAYAIDKLQDRGKFFIFPQEEVYAGQVVGEHAHEKDLVVNVTKSKKLTNMRASGSDEKARLIPPVQDVYKRQTGQSEPAMIPVRRLDISNISNIGWFSSAINIVGTP